MIERRALILTSRFPYPAFGGDKVALLNFGAALRGYRLTLLSLCCTREEMEADIPSDLFHEVHRVYLPKAISYIQALRAVFGARPLQLAYYNSGTFRRKVHELLPKNDIAIAHLIRSGQYIDERRGGGARVLLMSDAISLTYTRMLEQPGVAWLWRLIYRVERDRVFRYERQSVENFQQVWLHSAIDRRFLGLDQDEVKVVPIGIHLDQFPFTTGRSGNTIAFIGNMSAGPNLDAVRYFAREIFPVLRDRFGLTLRVIGACSSSVRRELQAYPRIEVTGAVPSIADVTDDVFCGICPIRGGAGIQNKILNYFALGIPCVSSEIGALGLEARPGLDLLVYHSAVQAVELIADLHQDGAKRAELAENGRKLVESRYDWAKIQVLILNQVERLVDRAKIVR